MLGSVVLEWAASSAGRAPRSQRGGREFDPRAVHQPSLNGRFAASFGWASQQRRQTGRSQAIENIDEFGESRPPFGLTQRDAFRHAGDDVALDDAPGNSSERGFERRELFEHQDAVCRRTLAEVANAGFDARELGRNRALLWTIQHGACVRNKHRPASNVSANYLRVISKHCRSGSVGTSGRVAMTRSTWGGFPASER